MSDENYDKIRWADRRIITHCTHGQPLDDRCGTCEHEAYIAWGEEA